MSGEATKLEEIEQALAEYKRAELYWDDLPGKCTEYEAHAISNHIKKHGPQWLRYLVDRAHLRDEHARTFHGCGKFPDCREIYE